MLWQQLDLYPRKSCLWKSNLCWEPLLPFSVNRCDLFSSPPTNYGWEEKRHLLVGLKVSFTASFCCKSYWANTQCALNAHCVFAQTYMSVKCLLDIEVPLCLQTLVQSSNSLTTLLPLADSQPTVLYQCFCRPPLMLVILSTTEGRRPPTTVFKTATVLTHTSPVICLGCKLVSSSSSSATIVKTPLLISISLIKKIF